MWSGVGLAFQDGGSVFLFASWLGLIGVEARAGAGVLLSGMIIDGAAGYELCVDGGMNALRCCLLRTCSRPLPSYFIRYCLKGSASTTIPELSHLVGARPLPFWIKTCWPGLRACNGLRVWLLASALSIIRVERTASLAFLTSFHLGSTDIC